jgi:uncharacterized protein YebE (UPF0316 family)
MSPTPRVMRATPHDSPGTGRGVGAPVSLASRHRVGRLTGADDNEAMPAPEALRFLTPLTVSTLVTGVLIYLARICDVSFGTVRTLMVVNGSRRIAFLLGFFEVLIWVVAASKVLRHLDQPFFAVMFALGAATGSFVGMTIERRVALGEQIVRVFTRRGGEVVMALRQSGFPAIELDGRDAAGPVALLFVGVLRRNARQVIELARDVDRECQYVLDDVRLTSAARSRLYEPTGWRAIFKRK